MMLYFLPFYAEELTGVTALLYIVLYNIQLGERTNFYFICYHQSNLLTKFCFELSLNSDTHQLYFLCIYLESE